MYKVKEKKVGYGEVLCRVNEGMEKREFRMMVKREEKMKKIEKELEM